MTQTDTAETEQSPTIRHGPLKLDTTDPMARDLVLAEWNRRIAV